MKKTDKLKHFTRLNSVLYKGFSNSTLVYKSTFWDFRFSSDVIRYDYTKSSFLTLTQRIDYKNNDFEMLHKEKTKLLQALKRHFGLRYYVSVSEFTKKGVIHYHLILFRVPYIPKFFISRYWTLGFNFISATNDKGAFYYLLSYFSKAKAGQKHLRFVWSKSFSKDGYFSFNSFIYLYFKNGFYNNSLKSPFFKTPYFIIKGLDAWIDRQILIYRFLLFRILFYKSMYFLSYKQFSIYLSLLERFYKNFPESIDL